MSDVFDAWDGLIERDKQDKTVQFYIQDDVLFKSEPMCGYNGVYHNTAVMTKDAFIACYKKWIKGDKE